MPFAGYSDFKDCIRRNKDPEAYCGKIKHKVEKSMAEQDWEYVVDIHKTARGEDGELYIAGYASNSDVDEDNEVMNLNSLKKAFGNYMKNPVVKFMHDKAPQWKGAVGQVVEKYTDTEGKEWKTSFGEKPFLVIKLSSNNTIGWLRDMVEEGIYKGLSIGGRAIRRSGQIDVQSWLETSIVDVPSAKNSFFSVVKMACPECEAFEKGEEIKPTAEEKKKMCEDGTAEEGECPIKKFVTGANDLVSRFETEEAVEKFSDSVGDFLKGGPGSGQKGHRGSGKERKIGALKKKYDNKLSEIAEQYNSSEKGKEDSAKRDRRRNAAKEDYDFDIAALTPKPRKEKKSTGGIDKESEQYKDAQILKKRRLQDKKQHKDDIEIS